MARLVKTSFGLTVILDNGVGPAGANLREGVGIVQFALKALTRGIPGPVSPLGGGQLTVPGEQPIVVDGIYGRQTLAYIQAYQEMRRKSPGFDGGPLPLAQGNFFGRLGGTGWPFAVLEDDAKSAGRQRLEDLVAADSTAPKWLKSAFFG